MHTKCREGWEGGASKEKLGRHRTKFRLVLNNNLGLEDYCQDYEIRGLANRKKKGEVRAER